jgi:hypothetical protein
LGGVTPVKKCAGISYGGYCWYFSPAHGSCDDACVGHGSCNLTGTTAYGSGGNQTICTALLGAMGAPTATFGFNEGSFGVGGLGCGYENLSGIQYFRDTDSTSCSVNNAALDTFLGASTYRACACTQ